MAAKRRKRAERALLVVEISLGSSARDHDVEVDFLGRPYRLVRLGTDGDLHTAQTLVRRWSAIADQVAVNGAAEAVATGLLDTEPIEATTAMVRSAPDGVATDGHRLREVLQEWAVRRVQFEMPGYFTNARTVVLGSDHGRAVGVLREYTDNLHFDDPVLSVGLSHRLGAAPLLGMAAEVSTWPLRQVRTAVQDEVLLPAELVNRSWLRRRAQDSDVVVAAYHELVAFGFADLHGKTVITSAVTDDQLADLASRDVDLVLDSTPQPFDVTVDVASLEAMMRAAVRAPGGAPERLRDDDLLEMIVAAGLEPRVLQPNGPRRKSRFAFVIHPLSQKFFRNVEPLGTVARVSPPVVMDAVEKVMAYLPPFVYSHVTGVTSPTGAEAEGWLITVGGTPKELLAHDPEFTYDKLLAAAEVARRLGAQVMGLGAFTKVVGDAGVTVARKASLPITTGNSYSASGALWAAHEAVDRLGLLERGDDGIIRGRTMVVGATGAIGSVCARLLALASDELWLVSPETAKLLALKKDIEREHPRAVVHAAATPGKHLGDMDVIVTATSGAGKRVLDIMAVKPGCVITDVARPLDLSAEDVAKRPDVIVVESGEIELPGEVRMRDIGLPPGVAYACLAETVALALEGRYETFTVGRAIEWEKVKEIYQLGLRHGMRLAAVSGVNGVYTDEDFDRVRALALAARGEDATATRGGRRTAV
ncbi:serine carboxypeptidase [Fodinibacter luteus]|uniref:Serine carboxypeptidase n=1 Tax=Fodinibacter luteus TaxID=552064 RepID=A0ABP8K5D1_9MICO